MKKEEREEEVYKLILELASGNFDYRVEPSGQSDEMNAIITGINMLGEELQTSTVSRDYLTSIFEGMVDMLIVLNPNGTIQHVNSSVEKLLLYNKKEIINQPFTLLFNNKEKAQVFLEGINTKLNQEGHCYNIEENFLARNGKIIPISCSCSLLYNRQKNITGVLYIAKDISFQKEAEAQLKQSKELFELALKASNDGIWDWDFVSDTMYISPRWKEMLGYKDHELRNSPESWKQLIYPEDYATTQTLIEGYNMGMLPELKVTQRYYHKNGSTVYLLSRAMHHKNEQGEIVRMLWAHTDITSQKLVEIELQKAKEQAEQASKSKSSFLANLSHEIRTPLNGILGFTDFLLQTNLNEEQSEYLKLVKSSSQTLYKLLGDILDLSKIEVGKLNLEYITFNFRQTVESCVAPYRYMALEKNLQFKLVFDEKIPNGSLKGDPTRINQILVNLIGNALKFTSEGGIAVHFEFIHHHPKNCNELLIKGRIIDTGAGVPADKQNLIFESFTQADSSITRKFGGSGLGLTIVKQLAALMGGNAGVSSPVLLQPFNSSDPGSEFWFTCSLAIDHTQQIATELLNKDLHFSEPYKILLVEDNTINQLVATKILKDMGLVVSIAEDGKEAIEQAGQKDFDLIFMDIQMPVMDGYSATQELRSKGYNRPIIGLSANVYKEDIDKCMDVGMNAHLGKPFTKHAMFDIVSRFIE